MANQEQLRTLKKEDVEVWNLWREDNPDVKIDLSDADLSGANLSGSNLRRANLSGANLKGAGLVQADFRNAYLDSCRLEDTKLSRADFRGAYFYFTGTYFSGTNLSGAKFIGVNQQKQGGTAKLLSLTTNVSISIMLQNKDFQPTQGLQPYAKCADCPMFSDFQDSRNRGWCSASEKLARTHHPRTNSCEFAIKEYEEQNSIEVAVTLCSHELDIDDDGVIFPKEERIISLFVEEITIKAVCEAFEEHQNDFPGFYILAFHRCYPDAEF